MGKACRTNTALVRSIVHNESSKIINIIQYLKIS